MKYTNEHQKLLLSPIWIKYFRQHLELENVKSFRRHLEHLPKKDLEWLVGFWEGDGSLSNSGSFTFTQKDPRILEYIKILLKIRHLSIRHSSFPNLTYDLYVPMKYSELLLPIFYQNLISGGRAKQLEKLMKSSTLNPKPTKVLTLPWIVGFWDAEGGFSNTCGILIGNLSQKDEEILEKVRKVIGGKINKGHGQLFLRREETIKFIPIYLKYYHNPQKVERLEQLQREILQGPQKLTKQAKEMREGQRKYYQAHKENHKKYCQKYYQTHKEEIRESHKEYYQTRKEEQRLLNQCSKYLRNNPDKTTTDFLKDNQQTKGNELYERHNRQT